MYCEEMVSQMKVKVLWGNIHVRTAERDDSSLLETQMGLYKVCATKVANNR